MDYSQLSDQEINVKVGKIVSKDGTAILAADGNVVIHEYADCGEFKGICLGWKVFDPCNNPAEAWPIIIENKISTMWMTSEKEWCAWAKGDLEEGTWDWENVPDYYFNCESHLRAAMVVFLMMQDAKHA